MRPSAPPLLARKRKARDEKSSGIRHFRANQYEGLMVKPTPNDVARTAPSRAVGPSREVADAPVRAASFGSKQRAMKKVPGFAIFEPISMKD